MKKPCRKEVAFTLSRENQEVAELAAFAHLMRASIRSLAHDRGLNQDYLDRLGVEVVTSHMQARAIPCADFLAVYHAMRSCSEPPH